MLLVTKLVLPIVKQKMDAVVENLYFNLSANNITSSTLKKFSLKKIDSNIIADVSFLHCLIQEAAGVKIVNTTNYDNNTSATIFFAANSKENLYFRNS